MCDTFCSIGSNGTLFAKNSDRSPGEVQLIEHHPARPGGSVRSMQYIDIDDQSSHAVLLSRPTWLAGAEHGVNEHAVAVGNERVYSRRDLSGPPALVGMDLVRLTLERAATADEALAVLTGLLAAHGQGGSCSATDDDPYDSSFLIADPAGGWVVETSGSDWAARSVTGSAAISNRYTLGADWHRASETVAAGTDVGDWHDPGVDTRLADHRLTVTSAGAQADPTPADAVRILRDHGPGDPLAGRVGADLSGVTVCMHVRDHLATTASMVAELGGDQPVWTRLCLGSPCVGAYLPAMFGAVPAGLADRARWQRSAGLRDRVEEDGTTLASIRAVLDPLEAELWARADELAATTDDPARHLSLAETSLARIDTTLVSLIEGF